MAQNIPYKTAINVTVPAKIILLGEHAVVRKGNHAVLWPIENLQVKLNVAYLNQKDGEAKVVLLDNSQKYRAVIAESEIETTVRDLQARHAGYSSGKNTDALMVCKDPVQYAKACAAIALSYVKAQQNTIHSLQITIDSKIPIGGFGSSAAVAAAIIKAVVTAHNIALGQQTWFELVFSAEKLQHGSPSGADVAVVTRQKPLVVCKRADGSVDVTELRLTSKVREIIESSLVLYAGQPHDSTVDTIQQAFKNPEYESVISQIEQNTARAVRSIQDGTLDTALWRELINTNGTLLERLGVVPQKWIQVFQDLRRKGWAMKVAGAGAISDGPCGAMVCVGEGSLPAIAELSACKLYTI